jgi:hypothetical protein
LPDYSGVLIGPAAARGAFGITEVRAIFDSNVRGNRMDCQQVSPLTVF